MLGLAKGTDTCRQRLLKLTASSLCQGNSSMVILDVSSKAFLCHYAGYTLLIGLGTTAARPTARPLPETPPSSQWSVLAPTYKASAAAWPCLIPWSLFCPPPHPSVWSRYCPWPL